MKGIIIKVQILEKCMLCPLECKVNRKVGQKGRCKAGKNIKIAKYSLHYDEEPCISGKEGSGTVFFSDCNLKCKFCQNYEISCEGKGKEISEEELSDIFINLQEKKANNINLVTAVPYVPKIVEAIKMAKSKGLSIPVLYNTSGYEKVETLKMLDGFIDIYLPDFKYYDNNLALRFSNVKDYKEVALKAILEMKSQVGANKYNEKGILQRGMIVRHLVLPNNIQNSKDVLKLLKNNLGDDIYISLMAQYFPTYKAVLDEEINRKLTKKEYYKIEQYLYKLNFKNGYIQDLEENEQQYVPKF